MALDLFIERTLGNGIPLTYTPKENNRMSNFAKHGRMLRRIRAPWTRRIPAVERTGDLIVIKALYAACAIALSAATFAQVAPNPWFGTWKLRLNAPDEKPETLIYSDAGDGAMRMVSVEENSIIVTRFDGTQASDTARSDNGPTLAVKAISSTSYDWTFFRAGQPYVRGINTLAPDHKTFTEVSWLIMKPEKTATLIYDRQ